MCETLLEKLEESLLKCDPPLNAVTKYEREDIIKQATESTNRYLNSRSLGPLDGVPVVVEDEIDVKGFETNVGTSIINKGVVANKDATIVERLREKGACTKSDL